MKKTRRRGLVLLVSVLLFGVLSGFLFSHLREIPSVNLDMVPPGMAWADPAPKSTGPSTRGQVKRRDVFSKGCKDLEKLQQRPARLLKCLRERDVLMKHDMTAIKKKRATRKKNPSGRGYRFDYKLKGNRRVTRSHWKRMKNAEVLQFDLDGDAAYDAARFTYTRRGKKIVIVLYDMDGDKRADMAREGRPNGKLDDVHVYYYEGRRRGWVGAVPGAPRWFYLEGKMPYSSALLPLPFFYG